MCEIFGNVCHLMFIYITDDHFKNQEMCIKAV